MTRFSTTVRTETKKQGREDFMKKAKKLASLLLALVMALALAVPAMATSETGTITLDNPQADQTYTAYKIFDVTYNEGKTAYSYTISGTSEWFNVVASVDATTGDVTSNVTGLTFTKAANEDTYVVTEGVDFSAAAFAAILKGKVVGDTADAAIVATGKPLTGADGNPVSVTGLELGYYFVSSTSGALCNLTTTNPSVTIHDKNDMPFDKVDDKDSVEIGEVVNYTITGKVPDTTGFSSYTYQITDKMSTGLTFNDNVAVYIDEAPITDNITLKTGADAGEYDFVLDIDVTKLTVGAKIEVKYSATVNENAVAKIEKNYATLEYSNDPTNDTSTGTREDEETVYSAKLVIDKYAKQPTAAGETEDTSKKLAGAEFVLMNEAKDKYYYYDEGTEKVMWSALAAGETLEDVLKADYDGETRITEVTTDASGAASFLGLKDGTYYLLETAAPAGYNLLDAPVTIEINGASATADDLASLTHTEGVANNTGTVLPSTGGMGTTIFYVTGSILVLAAVVLLVTKKRMNSAK